MGRWTAALVVAGAVARAHAGWAALPEPSGEGFDVQHYDLTLRPDFEGRSIAGHATITLRSRRDALDEVAFSPNSLVVDRARADGRPVAVTRREGALAFALPRPLRRGQSAALAIDFHGVPARGLTFGRRAVYTTYFACDWMFCAQDRPGDKATVTLVLVLPPGMTSVGMGRLRSRRRGRDGLERHVWRERRPYSSYVFGFAAGVFQAHTEREGAAWLLALSEDASPARLQALFAPTGAMLRFFESRAGVKLPHGRYTQVHVPGSEAQEAATFSVLGEDVVAPALNEPREDWAIAHELAHQWWGNLVTCRDWSHFWLNEGITTFMVAAWKEQRWGRDAYDREMDLARRRRDTAAKAGLDVPLSYPGPYPSLSLRRAITYSKAALFLDHLRGTVGERAFWRGLRDFTRTHAGGTVESRDFQRALERASKRDLAPLFEEWVY